MNIKIVAVFCLFDDMLNTFQHNEDTEIKMKDSKQMTTAFTAAIYFEGYFEKALVHLKKARILTAS